MATHIPVQVVVSIIKDELKLVSDEQKVALRRVLHEIRYVELRSAHPEEPPTWINLGDARIGQMGTTFDNRGDTITGKITAILRYQDGSERLQIVQGTARTGTTTLWADIDDVELL